jgi:hypothetical protein
MMPSTGIADAPSILEACYTLRDACMHRFVNVLGRTELRRSLTGAFKKAINHHHALWRSRSILSKEQLHVVLDGHAYKPELETFQSDHAVALMRMKAGARRGGPAVRPDQVFSFDLVFWELPALQLLDVVTAETIILDLVDNSSHLLREQWYVSGTINSNECCHPSWCKSTNVAAGAVICAWSHFRINQNLQWQRSGVYTQLIVPFADALSHHVLTSYADESSNLSIFEAAASIAALEIAREAHGVMNNGERVPIVTDWAQAAQCA